jgi:acyl-CoA synthetase (AMP-forming)/AMP-acid ligase II
MTYAELNEAVDRFANGLIARGIRKGDRVALFMQNCPQFVIGFFGILRAGGVVVSLNPMFKQAELEYQINASGGLLTPLFGFKPGFVGIPHFCEMKIMDTETGTRKLPVLEEGEIILWCKENMAAYKRPRVVEFRDELPRSAAGKILKRVLMRNMRKKGGENDTVNFDGNR